VKGIKRILLVDDSTDTLAALSAILRRRGYEVDCASSSETALDLTENCSFDVVVTDLKMPGLNGIDLIRQLEGIAPRPHFVLITGYPSEFQSLAETTPNIIDALFIKPFDPGLFVRTISEFSPADPGTHSPR